MRKDKAMAIEVSDFVLQEDIDTSLPSILILPIKISDEGIYTYQESVSTVLKILQTNSLPVKLAKGDFQCIHLQSWNSYEWFGPFLLFSATVLSSDPTIITVTLNIISNYLSNIFFKHQPTSEEPQATLGIIIEGSSSTKKINYSGPVSGIKEIKNIVKGIINE